MRRKAREGRFRDVILKRFAEKAKASSRRGAQELVFSGACSFEISQSAFSKSIHDVIYQALNLYIAAD
jgi:hypothetical protein